MTGMLTYSYSIQSEYDDVFELCYGNLFLCLFQEKGFSQKNHIILLQQCKQLIYKLVHQFIYNTHQSLPIPSLPPAIYFLATDDTGHTRSRKHSRLCNNDSFFLEPLSHSLLQFSSIYVGYPDMYYTTEKLALW